MENITENTTPRPFGLWLRTVDRLLAREFETAFESEGITRRDWRLLNLLSKDAMAPELAERIQRHGGKKLRALAERGWVVESEGRWVLTESGREARERLSETVSGIRARVAGAVSEEDFATTIATLEAVARQLGWTPGERMPRGHRRHGFAPRHGFGPGRGFGHGFGPRAGHGCERGHHAAS